VKALLGNAGIDRHLPAYSARHALIPFVPQLGFSKREVNTYTSCSDNSNTAPSHHFHPNGNRTGKRIVQEALMEVPEKAEEIIEDKYRERRRGRG
jgi:hypothetical protein